MPDFCTCGAQLPPDARFCHKCGKPQVEFPAVEPHTAEVEPIGATAPAAAAPGEVSFRDRIAVRTGLLAAGTASLLMLIQLPMYLNVVWGFVWLVTSGFFSVYLYRRRTGVELSVKKGARMGWITGVFCFVIGTVVFTVALLTISKQKGLGGYFREQLAAQGAEAEAQLSQVLPVLESPAGIAAIIILNLVMMFLLFTLLPTLGGAMGAKVLEKER
ncbi:MAG: zinc ribbon domain-containing protein [Bryobacteraceae bacterium]|nr:zinc ribbon domain-containing protein [Bryobacteraceae bacterium]